MEKLQIVLEQKLYEVLQNYHFQVLVAKIDLFRFWNIIKQDKLFKDYLIYNRLKKQSLFRIFDYYREDVLEEKWKNCIELINTYLTTKILNKVNLLNYVYFVSDSLLLFTEYVKFYNLMNGDFKNKYLEEISRDKQKHKLYINSVYLNNLIKVCCLKNQSYYQADFFKYWILS